MRFLILFTFAQELILGSHAEISDSRLDFGLDYSSKCRIRIDFIVFIITTAVVIITVVTIMDIAIAVTTMNTTITFLKEILQLLK